MEILRLFLQFLGGTIITLTRMYKTSLLGGVPVKMANHHKTIQFVFHKITMFENHVKMSHLTFPTLAFSTNFCPIKVEMSGNTV